MVFYHFFNGINVSNSTSSNKKTFCFPFCRSLLVTFSALAGIAVGPIAAAGAVLTRRTGTLIHVVLAHVPSKTCSQKRFGSTGVTSVSRVRVRELRVG